MVRTDYVLVEATTPVFQSCANRVVDGIEDGNLSLCTHVPLRRRYIELHNGKRETASTYHEHINSNLLPLVLEVVDVCARHALGGIRQYTSEGAFPAPSEARVERTGTCVYPG